MNEDEIKLLNEMFPGESETELYKVRQNMSMSEAVDYLLLNQQNSQADSSSILTNHAVKEIDASDELLVKVNRAVIFTKALALYKGAKHDPSILKKSVIVEFSGEEGVDAGALRNDFYEEALRQADIKFFEGQPGRRVPRCHWGSEESLEIVGCMIAHSLLQRGPGLPCLHPGLVHYLVTKNIAIESLNDSSILPVKDDIPQNASTMDLIDLIDKVNKV